MNGLDKRPERVLLTSWLHDAHVAYGAVATVVILAMGFWHLGGSTLFTYDKRIAVVEERTNLEKAVDGIRTQINTKIADLDLKTAALEIRVTRLEAKVDALTVSVDNLTKKVDEMLLRIPIPQPKPKPKTAARATASTSWLAGIRGN